MLGLYDLLAAGVPDDDVAAWLGGAEVGGLPRLSTPEARVLAGSWWFWARPGQFWTPGPEFITDYQAGRGWGKDFALSETICEAALDPERWGGHAIVVGPDPTQVKRDCLFGPSGIFAAADRRARAGTGPSIADRNLVDRWLKFDAPRGGGGAGLTVYWAASSDPKSVHGANVGLVWWDEFGVSYHRKLDEQGNNAWQALRPAVRAGPDPKIIITQTPSRAPEVRALQRDAERPECPPCRAAWVAEHGVFRGEPGTEPWRLPRSPQRRLHPLLNTRTTEPVRTCPACSATVIAEVRSVLGDTRDNPNIAGRARQDATNALATGQSWAFLRFAPRGEVDGVGEGMLVRDEQVERLPYEAPSWERLSTQVPDRWTLALRAAGVAPSDVVVFVDPAVTSTGSSDESGVVASGLAEGAGQEGRDRSVGLQDWSVRPDEVEGAPSAVWAPRAWRLAVLWGASRIVVEVNQGGDEVLSAVRDLVARPLSEAQALALLREEFPGASDARLGLLARRVAASSRGLAVESVRRLAPKPARVEWYGRTAALGQQAVLCCDWLGGARHWQTPLAQLAGYEPPREGAPASAKRGRKDRGDALVAGAQVNLGVRETARGEVEQAGGGWLGKVGLGGQGFQR